MSRKKTYKELVEETEYPRTRESLAADLRALGLGVGDAVIVHSSLSALGWVNGGAVTVVQALCDVVTDGGTIVMPTHTSEYSDPALWQNPPVPETWVEVVRDTLPVFDPAVTPTDHMGRVVEVFRTLPGALRSLHPVVSFAAWGRHARFVTEAQTYADSMGDASPIGRLYDLDGKVLLLGVGHDRNTSLHLAEYRVAAARRAEKLYPVPENGRNAWKSFKDISGLDEEWLSDAGRAFEADSAVTVGKVGSAEARLFSQRAAVDFAVDWIEKGGQQEPGGASIR